MLMWLHYGDETDKTKSAGNLKSTAAPLKKNMIYFAFYKEFA